MDSTEARFWSKVDAEGDCWLWTGYIMPNGYPQFRTGRKPHYTHRYAHRYVYDLMFGGIPDGMHIDHLCRVRHCVNPLHLEAVTQEENNRRISHAGRARGAQLRARDTCRNGHPWTPENTRVRRRGDRSYRVCRECTRKQDRERKRAARLPQAAA